MTSVTADGETCEVLLAPGTDPAAGHARALRRAIAPARIELVRRRLEDVFVELVAADGSGIRPMHCVRTCRA